MEALKPPLIICEAVIAEAAWQLGKPRDAVDQLYGMVEVGAARIVDLLADHVPRLRALATKYPKMYFCDAAMVRLAEIFPKTAVITIDSDHFTVYKKFRDKPPNLVHSDLK